MALTLPAPGAVRRVEARASLAYRDMPAFWLRLGAADGMGARALEFAILTASRTGEVLGAGWEEIDLEAGIWTIPAGRMKAGKEHRVPLSGAAVDLLRRLATVRQGPYAFSGAGKEKPLSNATMKATLRRLGRGDLTPHGFRATFRTWTAECTGAAHEVCEAALAHTVGDKVVAAYQRGDLFAKRRELMVAWAGFVTGESVRRQPE